MDPKLADWPGRELREPRPTHHAYLIYKPLVQALTAGRDRYVQPGARILDVGAGVRPYYPLFGEIAGDYIGNDVTARPGITSVCPVEQLDQPDASFDLVLCTQVLEHVRYPAAALAEMTRVLRPGGSLFLSTHGVYPWHPDPNDYWRWTQQGFEAMFEDVDGLSLVELQPLAGSAATLATLIAGALRDFGRIAAPLIAAVNLAGERIDRLTSPRVRERLVVDFLAIGQRVTPGPA